MTNRFTLVVLSSALTFAASSAEAQNVRLTPEVMNVMEKWVAKDGVDKTMSSGFATLLGLTVNLPLPDRQLTMNGTDGKIHAFVMNRAGDDVVLYIRAPSGIVDIFRARRDGMLVKALTFSATTKEATFPDPTKAQAELDDEIGFWTRSADKFASTLGK